MQRRWIFPGQHDDLAVRRLSREMSVPEFLARVLLRNGFGDCDMATAFLEPRLRRLEDPFALPEIQRAVEVVDEETATARAGWRVNRWFVSEEIDSGELGSRIRVRVLRGDR